MSVKNRCKDCFRESGMRMNFGDDSVAEIEFHLSKSCNCPYNSPEEMMIDQDMGLKDPAWLKIAKDFVDEYDFVLKKVKSKEESVRVFLKLLDFHTKNYRKSLELINDKNVELPNSVSDGRPKRPVKFDIFSKRFF